jgi:HD-like signal output (HDOD) protein
MVLGADLKDRNGRFLMGKGVRLTSKHLKIIKTSGVVEAEIEGVSGKDVGAKTTAHMDPATLELADRLTRQRFIHTDLEHEAISQLFNICVLRKAHEIANGAHTVGPEQIAGHSRCEDQGPLKKDAGTEIDPNALIRNEIELPSLPVVFSQINEAIADPRSSALHVANIISKDSSLSARLFKIANSALYSFPSKIDTISRAVAIIGTKQLSTLALGTCALNVFKDIPRDLIDMRSFWEHSIACGIIARIISSYKENTVTERFFLAGLLHDIGRLTIFKYLPVQAKEALLRAKQTNSLLYETEHEVMGFNHTLIGSILLKKWKLPMTLEHSVRYHHETPDGQTPLEPSIVHLSDIVTNALAIGSSGEQLVPPLDTKAWDEIGLSTGVLSATAQQADRHVMETVRIFFPKSDKHVARISTNQGVTN